LAGNALVDIGVRTHGLLEGLSGIVKSLNDKGVELEVDSSGVRPNLFFLGSADNHTGDSFLVQGPGVSKISKGDASLVSDGFAVADRLPK